MPPRHGLMSHTDRKGCRFRTRAWGPLLGLEGDRGLVGRPSKPFVDRPA